MTSLQSSKRGKRKQKRAAQEPAVHCMLQGAGSPISQGGAAEEPTQQVGACMSENQPGEQCDTASAVDRADVPAIHSDADSTAHPSCEADRQTGQAGSPSATTEPDSEPDFAPESDSEKPRIRALLAVSDKDGHHSSRHRRHHSKRRHRHHHHRHHRGLARRIARGILVGLLVLVLAVVIVAGAVALYLYSSVKAGEEKVLAAGRPKAAATQPTDASDDSDTQAAEHLYTPTINNTITYNGKTYAPNEKMVSVAFIGFDGGQTGGTVGQADAVVLFTFNLETGAVKVISIPRDSMVDVSEYAGDAYVGQDTMQLCLAYSYGDGAYTSSQRVANLVSRILYDVPVSYYFTLNLQGVAPLNDSIGGVTLTPLQTVAKSEDIVEGQETTLWGDDALLYVRWRDTDDAASSLDRQSRQMQYLQTFFAQVIAAAQADPTVIASLYNTATQYAWTNLGFDEFSYLASQALSTGITSVDVESLPGTMGMGERFAEFYLDKEGVRQVVLDTFYHEVSASDSTDKLSEQRGQADNASIASDTAATGRVASQAAGSERASTTDASSKAGSSEPSEAERAVAQGLMDAYGTREAAQQTAEEQAAGEAGDAPVDTQADAERSSEEQASAEVGDAPAAAQAAAGRSSEEQAALDAANSAVGAAVADW